MSRKAFWRWVAFILSAALVMTIAAIRYMRLENHAYEHAEAMRLEAEQREEARALRFQQAADKACREVLGENASGLPLNEYEVQCALHNGYKTPVVRQVRL